MAFPGGAGYGPTQERALQDIKRDLARGYISADHAAKTYGLSEADIADVLASAATATTSDGPSSVRLKGSLAFVEQTQNGRHRHSMNAITLLEASP